MYLQVTIATQTDEPVIPILPLAKHFYYNAEVVREEWGTGTQTDALRESIFSKEPIARVRVPETSSMKRFLDEFNQEEFPEPRTNPKRIKHNPPAAPSRLITEPVNVVKDDDPVREPFIDLSLGKVSKAYVRRMRMIAVIDHYEEKGRIRDLHVMTLQKRFSRDFKEEKEYSISGIRELLRSKGFGLDKYDRVKNFKR